MLLMLENQVVTTGSKYKINRSKIVEWKFHGTFSTSHHHARAAASRCSSYVLCRLIKPQKIFLKVIILRTNCQIT